MTRSEKLRKLANAIKDYKGSYHPQTGKWIRAPKLDKVFRVAHWLTELKVADVPGALKKVEEFSILTDMHDFLKTLEK